MSHVELLEMEGSVWGLIVVILAVTFVCVMAVAVAPWLLDQHRKGVARVQADKGGPLRRTDKTRWASLRHTGEETSWALQPEE